MSCRRICRELLWLSREGELGPSSQSHLDHLVGCRSCRDEVGFDREMVRQIRVALAERIDGIQPSSSAWEAILQRAQAPEPGGVAAWWRRSIGIVGRLRTATAMAGTGLALVLALQMEIAPPSTSTPSDGADGRASTQVEMSATDPLFASERLGVGGVRHVRTAQPHPESVMALPLARPDVPDMQVVLSQPGELVTLELGSRTVSSPPKATTTDEPGPEPEPEAVPTPSPAELGTPS